MRFLMKVIMPTETGNKLVKKGKLGETLQKILGDIKPEAAYFLSENGQRTGYLIVNMTKESEIIKYAEPFFLALDAQVEYVPVMTPADIEAGGAYFEDAIKKYG